MSQDKAYLSAAGRVLGSTSSKVLRVVLGSDIIVEEQVFFLSENCVVGLELVLVEKFLVSVVKNSVRNRITVGAGAC